MNPKSRRKLGKQNAGDRLANILFTGIGLPAIGTPTTASQKTPSKNLKSSPATEKQEDQIDDFFGNFEDLFITNEDLKVAKEKLDEEKSRGVVMNEIVFGLNTWSYSNFNSNFEKVSKSFNSISLCYNFIILGIGKFDILDSNSILFETKILSSLQVSKYLFPIDAISDIRLKKDQDKTLLLCTLRYTEFIQFLVSDYHEAEEMLCLLKRRNIKEEEEEEFEHLDDCDSVELDDDRESVDFGVFEDVEETLEDKLDEIEQLKSQAKKRFEESIRIATEVYDLEVNMIDESLRVWKEERDRNCPAEGDQDFLVGECELCCDNLQSLQFEPCKHRVCEKCFDRLDKGTCPWDKRAIEGCINLAINQ